jgi:hypothetical protein
VPADVVKSVSNILECSGTFCDVLEDGNDDARRRRGCQRLREKAGEGARARARETVCVFVCVRERERERLCVCVRERERETPADVESVSNIRECSGEDTGGRDQSTMSIEHSRMFWKIAVLTRDGGGGVSAFVQTSSMFSITSHN